mgnify:CR=1 FL=1
MPDLECPVCGAEVSPDDKKCPFCGEPLNGEDVKDDLFKDIEEEETIECPVCGEEFPEGTSKCTICGEPLEEEGEEKEDVISDLERELGITPAEEEEEEEDLLKELEDELAAEESELDKEVGLEIDETGEVKVKKKQIKTKQEEVTFLDRLPGVPKVEIPEFSLEKVKKYDFATMLTPIYSFLLPLFLLIFVSLEFFIVLVMYPLAYPAQVVLYLTPMPFVRGESVASITISFLVCLGLFLTTLQGYNFKTNTLNLSRKRILIPFLLSLMIGVSLAVYIYLVPFTISRISHYLLFILIMILLASQFDIIKNHKNL